MEDGDNWGHLFELLRLIPGWGDKTAALFVKATIKLHNDRNISKKYHFWSDASLKKSSLISSPYLPVDRVIEKIFEELKHPNPKFKLINDILINNYSSNEMLIWDDLWFWGFFTQNSSGKKRVMGWNSGKFWGQISTPKNTEHHVKRVAEKFIGLLR